MEPSALDSEETRRLLERAGAGEAEAREQLLARHREYLCRLVEARMDPRLRGRLDPSDVVQEAQIEAARRLDNYLEHRPLPFRLWLRQIAFDRLLMLHRRHVRAARRAVEREVPISDRSSLELARQILAPGTTPSQNLVRQELVRRVRQAVGQLPEGEREVLLMRNLEGLSNREVAEVLRTDPATTSRRYGRALIRLRGILHHSGLTESES